MDNIEKEGFLAHSKLKSFKKKVEKAKELITEACLIGKAYVAISWGKDSTVMLHLCQSIQPDILAIYHAHIERDLISNYSGVIKQYCDRVETNLRILETQDAEQNMAKDNPYKEYPVSFLGIRAEENKRRKMVLKQFGLLHQYKTGFLKECWRCAPIGWWTWQDVWAYIVLHDLPYLKAYDISIKGRDLSRTTDHISKNLKKDWQKTRYNEIKVTNPAYADYLKLNYPEVFQ